MTPHDWEVAPLMLGIGLEVLLLPMKILNRLPVELESRLAQSAQRTAGIDSGAAKWCGRRCRLTRARLWPLAGRAADDWAHQPSVAALLNFVAVDL